MIYLLILILFVVFLLSYVLSGRDIFSPTNITLLVFLFGAIVASIGLLSWNNISFTGIAIIVLLFSLASMLCGEMVSGCFYKKSYITQQNLNYNDDCKPLRKSIYFFNNVVCLLTLFFYYRRVLEIALKYGYQGHHFLQYVRSGLLSGEHNGAILSCMITWCKVSAYFSVYYFIKSCFLSGLKRTIATRWHCLICVAVLSIIFYLSSSRFNFIKLISFTAFCYVMLYKETSTEKIRIRKIIALFVISVLLIVLMFFLMGKSRASFSVGNAFNKLIVYTGSSIPLLDYGITHRNLNSCDVIAGRTLNAVWGILKTLGLTKKDSLKFLNLVQLNEIYESNVYTMQYNLLMDYGFIGLLVIEFFIGFFYGIAYKRCVLKKSDIGNIFYCNFAFYLVIQLWNPSLFQEFLMLDWILELFLICFLYKIISKSRVQKVPTFENKTIIRERKLQ